jgi:hypothetical protein
MSKKSIVAISIIVILISIGFYINIKPETEIKKEKKIIPKSTIEKKEYELGEITSITFEEIFDVKKEDIFELNEAYAGFIEKYDEAIYFKTDFTPIFEKNIGDEVSININGTDFIGYLKNAEIRKLKHTNIDWFSFRIQPDLEQPYDSISINGYKDPDTKKFEFNGNIEYKRINNTENYRFSINEKLGVLISDRNFNKYLDFDLGIKYD